ncbi:MAG: toll/interleukin-1 receptor domain-containing protein [Acidobacteria bacterium]|nr:MAG: toll/interleukin-1 receptor domain-containing protein [Acidobacteriota bacterium]
MTVEPRHDVFISYSSPDVGLARELARVLEEQKVSVWWDRGERDDPARGTVSEILAHLMPPVFSDCRYLLVIATGAALASDWVAFELSSFLDTRSPVLAWHPSDDDFDPRPFRGDIKRDAYMKVVALVEHPAIISHYDLPRSEVVTVARNVALMVRFFRFIENQGAPVNNDTKKRFWDSFVETVRQS